MADRKQHCRKMLIALCPEMFRPMAEMMIPMVLPEMSEDDLVRIENKLEEALEEPDELKRVQLLLGFVRANGGEVDLTMIPPEIKQFIFLGEEL